jgi:glutamate racemase
MSPTTPPGRTSATQSIGVFDSGVGGLTVAKALMARLPNERLVYLGDTARVPYGTRSAEVVTRYSLNNARFLLQHDLKALMVACNTASAACLPELIRQLPIPVLGVIEPGARAAAARTRTGRVGVIGTPGTIRSGAYQRALAALNTDIEVVAQACPLFVPLAEEGWTGADDSVVCEVAERYLGGLRRHEIDVLVLGCTHYPLLSGAIGKVMGDSVTLVDSAAAAAEEVEALLTRTSLLNPGTTPEHRFFVTDLPERFGDLGMRFLGRPLPHAEQVDI